MSIDALNVKTVLLSRVDNIGDVVLTLPMAAWIKQQNPNVKIYFLARSYVRDIVLSCPFVDEFIDWTELSQASFKDQVGTIKSLNLDVFVHVFASSQLAKLSRYAGVPFRVGSNRRVYNWIYCNKLINFSRKNSLLHEAQLNFQLLRAFGLSKVPELEWFMSLQLFGLSDARKTAARQLLNPNKITVILHPLSNGNGREWPVQSFAELANMLDKDKYQIIVTGSESEGGRLQHGLFARCPGVENWCGKLSLAQLLDVIAVSDGLVASGTGPLHIAAACGTNAVGLFPQQHGINPQRWAPLGARAQYLLPNAACAGCSGGGECVCMQNITPKMVLDVISTWK